MTRSAEIRHLTGEEARLRTAIANAEKDARIATDVAQRRAAEHMAATLEAQRAQTQAEGEALEEQR